MRLALLAVLSCLGFATSTQGQTILLDNFSDPGAMGAVVGGSSWDGGNVVRTSTSITIAGTAKDDNGWGWTGDVPSAFNATGMNHILVTAQRDAGHDDATFLNIRFEDAELDFQIFTVSTTAFSAGAANTVQIDISGWDAGFDFNQITGWSIGGGSEPGLLDFRMTVDNLAFSAVGAAIPEPGAYAAMFGALSLGLAIARRARSRQARCAAVQA